MIGKNRQVRLLALNWEKGCGIAATSKYKCLAIRLSSSLALLALYSDCGDKQHLNRRYPQARSSIIPKMGISQHRQKLVTFFGDSPISYGVSPKKHQIYQKFDRNGDGAL